MSGSMGDRQGRARELPFVVMMLLAACESPPAVPAPISPPELDLPSLSGPRGEVVDIRRVANAADVPMSDWVDAEPGDWLLSYGERVAVVSSRTGELIDLGMRNGRDALVRMTPLTWEGLDTLDSSLIEVQAIENTIRSIWQLPTRQAFLVSWVFVDKAALAVETVLIADDEPILNAALGGRFAWGNVPTFIDGVGAHATGTHRARWFGRSHEGAAFAACSASTTTVSVSPPGLAGFHNAPTTINDPFSLKPGGESPRHRVYLANGPTFAEALATLPCAPSFDGTITLRAWASDYVLELADCNTPSTVPPEPSNEDHRPALTWDVNGHSERRTLRAPSSCRMGRIRAPGWLPSPWTKAGELSSARMRGGLLEISAQAARPPDFDTPVASSSMPAKVVIRGYGDTIDPDWGEGGSLNGSTVALNIAYINGYAKLPLPPGTYDVSISRGPEYERDEARVTINDGDGVDRLMTIVGTLERSVDTTGWIASDLHIHSMPSPDAPTQLEDRVRSLVGVGLEAFVATDHNRVTDFGPTIRTLGLKQEIASIVGDEITTEDVLFGHFNVFPLVVGSPPVPFRAIAPRDIFSSARSHSATGDAFAIQVNHPRMGSIGYLDLLRFDRSDVAGWLQRVPLADLSFDAMEVFNGDHYAYLPGVEHAMRDWYALLNAGYRITATGNSDSHKVSYHEAGVPRTWVAVPETFERDRNRFDDAVFTEALRQGRAIVSSGPFCQLHLGGVPIGGTTTAGEKSADVDCQVPSWMSLDHVHLVVNGEVVHRWKVTRTQDKPLRFQQSHTLNLQKGDWVIATARGDTPMPDLHRPGAKPFAFTNPVFVE